MHVPCALAVAVALVLPLSVYSEGKPLAVKRVSVVTMCPFVELPAEVPNWSK